MDFSMIYALFVVIFTLGIVFFVSYLRKKKLIKVDVDDLIFIVSTFQITLDIVNELNLKSEPYIKKIGEIITKTLTFIQDNYADEIDKYELSCGYAFTMCDDLDIPLTEERMDIIRKLILIGLRNTERA